MCLYPTLTVWSEKLLTLNVTLVQATVGKVVLYTTYMASVHEFYVCRLTSSEHCSDLVNMSSLHMQVSIIIAPYLSLYFYLIFSSLYHRYLHVIHVLLVEG